MDWEEKKTQSLPMDSQHMPRDSERPKGLNSNYSENLLNCV